VIDARLRDDFLAMEIFEAVRVPGPSQLVGLPDLGRVRRRVC
jgi:hypothetical protein